MYVCVWVRMGECVLQISTCTSQSLTGYFSHTTAPTYIHAILCTQLNAKAHKHKHTCVLYVHTMFCKGTQAQAHPTRLCVVGVVVLYLYVHTLFCKGTQAQAQHPTRTHTLHTQGIRAILCPPCPPKVSSVFLSIPFSFQSLKCLLRLLPRFRKTQRFCILF